MAEDTETIFDEDTERSWRAYLAEFRDDVWPVMQSYGFTSFDMAFQCWLTNRMSNDICNLIAHMHEGDDAD